MRTITEMQKEIKNISSALEELSKDIMDFEKKDEKPAEDVFKKIKVDARRNPILEHPLSTKDDVIKTHYMTLLVSAIYSTNKKPLDAWLLAQRIACGISLSQELSDISLDASSLTEKQIDEFTYSIIENNLEEIFSFDLLLLFAVCDSSDSKMLEYIATLISLVNCSKQKLDKLSVLAKIVVSQNSNEYLDFCLSENGIDLTQFFGYIKLFHKGILACNQDLFYCWYNKKEIFPNDLFKKLPDKIKSKNVCIENTIFRNITKEEAFFIFDEVHDLQINNCSFIEIAKSISINETEIVHIKNSEFKKMTDRAFRIRKAKKIFVENDNFIECEFSTSSDYVKAYGGVFFLESIKQIEFEKCNFESCFARHGESVYDVNGAAVYFDGCENANFLSCKFKNCYCEYYKYSSWWKDHGSLIDYSGSLKSNARDCSKKDCSELPYGMEDGFSTER